MCSAELGHAGNVFDGGCADLGFKVLEEGGEGLEELVEFGFAGWVVESLGLGDDCKVFG